MFEFKCYTDVAIGEYVHCFLLQCIISRNSNCDWICEWNEGDSLSCAATRSVVQKSIERMISEEGLMSKIHKAMSASLFKFRVLVRM